MGSINPILRVALMLLARARSGGFQDGYQLPDSPAETLLMVQTSLGEILDSEQNLSEESREILEASKQAVRAVRRDTVTAEQLYNSIPKNISS